MSNSEQTQGGTITDSAKILDALATVGAPDYLFSPEALARYEAAGLAYVARTFVSRGIDLHVYKSTEAGWLAWSKGQIL